MINVCKICGLEYPSKRKLSRHLNASHKITMIKYYDQYYRQDGEGYCKVCGKPTKFSGFRYKKTCSNKCAEILRQNPNITPATPIPKVIKHLEYTKKENTSINKEQNKPKKLPIVTQKHVKYYNNNSETIKKGNKNNMSKRRFPITTVKQNKSKIT